MRWVLAAVGAGVFGVGGRVTCGFFLSLSVDLVAWTPVQLIRQAKALYYVVWNQGLDRDLWRVPLTFERVE